MKHIRGLLIFAAVSAMSLGGSAYSNVPRADVLARTSGNGVFSSESSNPSADPFLSGDASPISHRDIARIQAALDKHGFSLAVDGVWGPETEKALHRFQGDRGLPQTNLIDHRAAEQLDMTSSN